MEKVSYLFFFLDRLQTESFYTDADELSWM